MEITADLLVHACGDDGRDGGLKLVTDLEPLAGRGAPVKPAVYAGQGGQIYQTDKRWVPEADGAVDVVVIDSKASQPNRHEAELDRLASALGLPKLVLDLSGTPLPPHLPTAISSFRFPHRHADSYLRDATLDGQAFSASAVGAAIRAATPDDPHALFQWVPQSLLYGYWQSHLGKKGSQSKLARSWVSEIVGISPASLDQSRLGVKGDPLNLSVTDRVQFDENEQERWTLLEGQKKGAAVKGAAVKNERLSEIGHGQVVAAASKPALSFARIEQTATVAFAGLRRIWVGDPDANATGRALLVALGLLAHVEAFGRAFSLRSDCDLRPVATKWTWLGSGADSEVDVLDAAAAGVLFGEVVSRAEAAGVPVGSAWASAPLVLTPNDELTKVIASTYALDS
jgi:CRISPR-associated protein Csb1